MPMVETDMQHTEIMPYFCREEVNGGLGYRETANNIVSDDLFIPSQLAEFVKTAAPQVWSGLLKRFHSDEKELTCALKDEIKSRLLGSPNNTAVFFNKNKNINFCGETVPLYIVSGSELNGDEGFKKNIFAAVEEMTHKVVCDGVVLQTLRPDISFFLNGIFIGYMELKSITNNQSAAVNGRGKIICDYLESVSGIADRSKARPVVLEDKKRRETLFLFEKAIHITATDVNETFVLRSPGAFYEDAKRGFLDHTATVTTLRPEIEKVFKPYPVSSLLLTNRQKFREVAEALYGKKSIEKEILYYNFVQYKYSGKANAKRIAGDKNGTPISPRPKQKYGCDKIINRVREMLEHEAEPDFYRNQLKKELEGLLPGNPEKVAEILEQRDRYCNNKYVYSLLLQYAAGFGKSNIIGWTALQLKNLRHGNSWAFDKILIVVDRLQLRDQIDTMMHSMNIDKSMFVEVTSQPEFVAALSGLKRIVVVNIQKFGELQNALDESGTQLDKMRVAFLIDEIHRSNTGKNNEEMIDIFEKLQGRFRGVDGNGAKLVKKNLIVGFTATPTPEILARFGEFKSASIIPTWVPFDAYTMREAIDDGYILDPTKHIIAVQKTMQFSLPPGVDPESDLALTLEKDAVYGNETRMKELADFIVTRLVSTVYPRIGGYGKAMLACRSIPLAVNYCQFIRNAYKIKCEEPAYRRFKDAPVSIVYSDNQENPASASLNNGNPESKVIKDFKDAKNGLMIVVDKLQTGFDEPKLHTLFLDKEIRDIAAIQTISRVNRTCRGKQECHVIDLTWRNVNIENIREAFKKFENMVISDFDPDMAALQVEMLYRILCKSDVYIRWFAEYRRRNGEAAFMLQMEDGIRNWIRMQFERASSSEALNEAKELRKNVGEYGKTIEELKDVLDIDKKYRAPIFLSFWLKYCNIYRITAAELANGGGNGTIHPDVDAMDDVPGITIVEEPEQDEEDDDEGGNGGGAGGNGNSHARNLWDLIQFWNAQENVSLEEKKVWLAEVGKMFDFLLGQQNFMSIIFDDQYLPEEKQAEYNKILVGYKFRLRRSGNLVKADLFVRMLDDNAQQFLANFLDWIPEAEDVGSDFCSQIDDEDSGPQFTPVLVRHSANKNAGRLADDAEDESRPSLGRAADGE